MQKVLYFIYQIYLFIHYPLALFLFELNSRFNWFYLFHWSLDQGKSRVAMRTRYRWYWELGQASLLLTYIILKYERSPPPGRLSQLGRCPDGSLSSALHSTLHCTLCTMLWTRIHARSPQLWTVETETSDSVYCESSPRAHIRIKPLSNLKYE